MAFHIYMLRCADGLYYSKREEALARERQIKGWSRAKKEALIKGNWTRLSRLSRGPGSTSSP